MGYSICNLAMSTDPLRQLEMRCREQPDNPAALFDLAGAYEHAGDLGHAFLTYSRAIEKNWGEQFWIDFHLRFYADALAAQERVYGEIEKRAQENPQPAWRAYWAFGLAKAGRLETAFTELARAARAVGAGGDPPPEFLREAYRAVAAGLLTQGLEDRHEWVRRQAAQALADLGDRKSGV